MDLGERNSVAAHRHVMSLHEATGLWRPKNVRRQFLSLQKKKMFKPYFIVIMITILITSGIFWVVNFKTQNYFVIFYYTDLRLSMYSREQ
jgi:hypothetical protein